MPPKLPKRPGLPHGTSYDTTGPFREKLYDCSEWLQSTVYKEIATIEDEWEIVDPNDAQKFLPESKPPRKLKLGIKEQREFEMSQFESVSLNQVMQYKRGHVINVGSSVWGLGFAPKNPLEESQITTQYLAVAGYKGAEEESHHFSEVQPRGSYKNCIQLWRLELTVQGEQAVDPVLDVCILHDFGIVRDLKWCPYGAYEESTTCDIQWLPKLGILGVVFGDDTTQMIVVPHPQALRKHLGQSPDDQKQTIYLRLKKSRATLSVPGAAPTCVSWGGPKKISTGYDNGYIAVWDAQTILQLPEKDVQESLYFCAPIHETVVRCIAWHGYKDPVHFVSCGNDSHIKLTDYRDPWASIPLQRSRTTSLFEVAFMGFDESVCFQDSDKSIRSQPVRSTGALQGTKQTTGKTTMLSIAGSEMHPFYLLAFADGWVNISNLHFIKDRKAVDCQFAYKLDYDEVNDVYRYVDGIPPKTIEQIMKDIPSLNIPNRRLAVQKAVWCPNGEMCGWAATACANGLCRVEFLGRGTGWK